MCSKTGHPCRFCLPSIQQTDMYENIIPSQVLIRAKIPDLSPDRKKVPGETDETDNPDIRDHASVPGFLRYRKAIPVPKASAGFSWTGWIAPADRRGCHGRDGSPRLTAGAVMEEAPPSRPSRPSRDSSRSRFTQSGQRGIDKSGFDAILRLISDCN